MQGNSTTGIGIILAQNRENYLADFDVDSGVTTNGACLFKRIGTAELNFYFE